MATAAATVATTTTPPPRTDKPAGVYLDTVASLTGKTIDELEEMLAERGRQVAEHGRARLCDLPEPTDPDGPQFDRAEIISWAQRMGWRRYRGRAVIGYSGMAVLLDLGEQSLRKLSTVRQHHIRREHAARLEDIPAPLPGTGGKFTLFDLAAVRRWAIQTGRLAADGQTPTPLRPATSALRQAR